MTPPRHSHYVEPDFAKRPTEKTVHLITPAATPLVNDLVEYSLDVEVEWSTQLNVQVLVRDMQEMLAVNLAQGFEIDARLTLIVDAGQIFGQLHDVLFARLVFIARGRVRPRTRRVYLALATSPEASGCHSNRSWYRRRLRAIIEINRPWSEQPRTPAPQPIRLETITEGA